MNFLFHIQYNSFSIAFLEAVEQIVTLPNRLKSSLIDFILTAFAIIPVIPVDFILTSFIDSDITNYTLPAIFVVLFLIKDLRGGKSIGKRLTGYAVEDNKTGQTPSTLQTIIRNITVAIWPLEALLLLGTPDLRIGDYFARTKVVEAAKSDPKDMLSE